MNKSKTTQELEQEIAYLKAEIRAMQILAVIAGIILVISRC